MQEQINELCTLASCNNVLFFESRKKRDLYLWVGKFPTGPSTKFHVENGKYIYHQCIDCKSSSHHRRASYDWKLLEGF